MVGRPLQYEKVRYENLLLALVEQASGAEEVKSYPIGLIFDPSAACGLRCPMCPVSYETEVRPKAVLRWDLFDRIVDEMGPYLFFVDFFNWGEPLLNKNLPEMLAKLKQKDIEVRISSSLSVQVPDSVLESFVEHGLDCLTVSIDGFSQENYEKYRVRGNLKLALSNMQRLAEIKRKRRASRPIIDWQYLVFSFNEHELEQAREFAAKIGVDFRAAAPYVDTDKYPDWLSTQEQYVKDIYKPFLAATPPSGEPSPAHDNTQPVASASVAATTKGPIAAGVPQGFSFLGARPQRAEAIQSPEASRARQERMLKLAGSAPKRCDWHYLISVVNANGSVSPCCATQEESHDFGSAADRSFQEVWNNQNYRRARRFFATSGYSKLADPKGLLCYECIVPDDQGRCDEHVERFLRSAPEEIVEQARHILPPYWANRLPSKKGAGLPGLPLPTSARDTLFSLDLPGDSLGSIADLTTGDWSPVFTSGFHSRESHGVRWLSESGMLNLRVPGHCEYFLLEGVAPKEVAEDGTLKVSIRFGDWVFAEVPIPRPGLFVSRLPVPGDQVKPLVGQFIPVALTASRSFVPAECDLKSPDQRRLSIAIKRVGFATS